VTHSPDIQFPTMFARLLTKDGAMIGTYEIGRVAIPPHIIVLDDKRAFRLTTGNEIAQIYVETTVRFTVTPASQPPASPAPPA
jgi:hypothetical protein